MKPGILITINLCLMDHVAFPNIMDINNFIVKWGNFNRLKYRWPITGYTTEFRICVHGTHTHGHWSYFI